MLSEEFIRYFVLFIDEAIVETGLPLDEILDNTDQIIHQELDKHDYNRNKVFDIYSYAVFKSVVKYIDHEKRIIFTQLIGKKIYDHIKKTKNISVTDPNNVYEIKKMLEEIISFFEENGYVESAYIDWSCFDEEKWKEQGNATLIYIMDSPVILSSAKRLFNEEKFAQHFSTRTFESAFLACGIDGRETDDFKLNENDTMIKERWELKKIENNK